MDSGWFCDFQFSRKRFNVDSPSFTPSLLSANGSTATTPTKKTATISPKAANAAPFQPRSVSSRMVFFLDVEARAVYWLIQGSNASTPTSSRQDAHTPDWTVAEAQEFVPQGFEAPPMVNYTHHPRITPIFTALLKWGPFLRQEFAEIWKKQRTRVQQLTQFVRHLSREMVTVALQPLVRLILLWRPQLLYHLRVLVLSRQILIRTILLLQRQLL